jgi:hypothetical protein
MAVILSEAKNLYDRRDEILRFAQDDGFDASLNL